MQNGKSYPTQPPAWRMSAWACALLAGQLSLCAAAGPALFYSDLEGGPNRGGQNDAGAFVTLYGRRFGASRATSYVTVGGSRVAGYPLWSDSRITFQLGPDASTGEVVVHTSAGDSNALPFTVRQGGIYFVSLKGDDSSSGSYQRPWRTLLKARDTIQPGDTVYAMDGVSQTSDDGQGWRAAMLLRRGGSPGLPMALVAYPGASVTIGTPLALSYGIRVVDNGACPGHWVLAGLTLRGLHSALSLAGASSSWRIIGNDLSCPNGNAETGCLATSKASSLAVFGNSVHDVGAPNASAHYHGVYFSTDSNDIDLGWNTVSSIRGCRGIQFYSTPLGSGGSSDPTGRNLHGIRVHDNVIHDTQCDGLILATVDPSLGPVEVFNNVIFNAGTGPNNPERTGAWTCINVPGSTANGAQGGGTVEVFHNTLVNCGSFSTPPYLNSRGAVENGGNNPALKIRLRNNIIAQNVSSPYLVALGTADAIYGSNNLFFGNGTAPSSGLLTRSVGADPQLRPCVASEWCLSSASPARNAGVQTNVLRDLQGAPRGGAAGYDLGALQYSDGPSASVFCSPSFILVPGSAVCKLALADGAGTESREFTIRSDTASLSTPASVNVVAGATEAAFAISATTPESRVLARLTLESTSAFASVALWLIPSNDPGPTLTNLRLGDGLEVQSVAPGQLVWLVGSGLGPQPATPGLLEDGRRPNRIGDTQVLFDGNPSPLLFASPGALLAAVPFLVAGKAQVTLEVASGGRLSNPSLLRIAQASPELLGVDSAGGLAAVNADGTLNSEDHPAAPGSTVMLFATGLGLTAILPEDGSIATSASPALLPVTVSLDGLEVETLSAGTLPGASAGVYGVSLRLPVSAPRGNRIPLTLRAGPFPGRPAATIAIQ